MINARRSIVLAITLALFVQCVPSLQVQASAADVQLTNSVPMIDPNTSSVVSAGLIGDTLNFTVPTAFDAAPTVTFAGTSANTATATQSGTTTTYSVVVPSGAITGPYTVTGNVNGASTTLTSKTNFQLWKSRGEPYAMPDGHVNITYQDLKFILDNIKMGEAHSLRTRAGGATGVPSNALQVGIPTSTLIFPYDVTTTSRCLSKEDVANAAKNTGPYSLGLTGLSAPYVWTQEDPLGVRQVDGQCNNISNVQAEAPLTTIYTSSQAADSSPKIPITPLVAAGDTAGWGAADELFTRFVPGTTGNSSSYTLDTTQNAYKDPTTNVVDPTARDISNLISDQTTSNPAAVIAAYDAMGILYGQNGYIAENSVNATTGNVTQVLDIPNITPDYNVAAGYNSAFTIFGQFFDHGLDLIPKAGPSVLIPLKADDPLYTPGQNNFMVLTRGQDSNGDAINETTPWIDQSQSYGSHPSQNFFLREYTFASSGANITITSDGRMIEGQDTKTNSYNSSSTNHGLPTWFDIKVQARNLGFNLTDYDAISVPVIATDQYGKFLPGPHGYPMMLFTDSNTRKYVWIEGNGTTPISTGYGGLAAFPSVANFTYPSGSNWKAVTTGHPFLNDTTASAVPYAASYCPNRGARLNPDGDNIINSAGWAPNCSTYDNETLDIHYIAGDGRVNENISLSAFHNIFHSEHNLLVKDITDELNNNPIIPTSFKNEFLNNPDRLYQAARFVMEMEYQHMAYDEFVRRIAPNLPVFITYDPSKNPAVTQEFASAVYRLGHSMLNETIPRSEPNSAYDPTNNQDVSLLDAFTNPSLSRMRKPAAVESGAYSNGTVSFILGLGQVPPKNGDVATVSYMDNAGFNIIDGIVKNSFTDGTNSSFAISQQYKNGSVVNISAPTVATSNSKNANGLSYATVIVSNPVGGFDYTPLEATAMLIQGLNAQRGNEIDEFTTDAVRNNLLGLPLDLPSLNIARGRDVGVPTFNQYRAKVSSVLQPYTSWVDLINHLRHPESGANFIAAYGTHSVLTNSVKIATASAAAANGGAITYTFTPVFNSVFNAAELPRVGDIVDISGFSNGNGALKGGVISAVSTSSNPMTFTVASTVANDLTAAKSYASTDPTFYGDLTPVNLTATIDATTTALQNVTRQPTLAERRIAATMMTTSTFPSAISDAKGANGQLVFTSPNIFTTGQIVKVSGIKGASSCFNQTGTVTSSDATQFTLSASTPNNTKVVSIANVSWLGGVASYQISGSTNFASGNIVSITGFPKAGYNLVNATVSSIQAVSGKTYFKVAMASDPGGSVTASAKGYLTGPSNLVTGSTYSAGAGGSAIAVGNDVWAALPDAPSDTNDFMNSSNQGSGAVNWTNIADSTMGATGTSKTGVDAIDLWMGGLAENPAKQPILPSMLGTTFQQVYAEQVGRLQDGDRFYYLGRLMGFELVNELQGQKFQDMAMRNTPSQGTTNPTGVQNLGLVGLSSPAFSISDCFVSTNSALVPVDTGCDASTMFTNPNTGNLTHVGLDNITMFADPSSRGSASISGGAGDDSIHGGAGNDILVGDLGGDIIKGGTGNDRIFGGDGEDIIQGGSGHDVINTGNSQIGDLANGGSGSDWITCGNCSAVIPLFSGGTGNDFIQGGANADLVLSGDEGDDWLEGLGGWDIMNGDTGINQSIYNTTTQIYGGNDVLFGGPGVNTISGDGGDDIFLMGQAVDQPFGMAGFDWGNYEYSTRFDNGPANRPNIWVDLAGGTLSPNTSRQGDLLQSMEALSGSSGNDQLYGGIGIADATYKANVISGSNVITVPGRQAINPGIQVSGVGIGANATVVSAVDGPNNSTVVTLTVANINSASNTNVVFTTWPVQTPSLITNFTSVLSGTPGWNKYTAIDPAATKWSGGAVILGGDGNDSIFPSSGSDVIHGSAYLHTCIAVSSAVTSTVYSGLADVPCGNGSAATSKRGFSNMSLLTPLLESGDIRPDQLRIVREILPTSSPVTALVADGKNITYTAANNYYVGEVITISKLAKVGIDLKAYNLTNVTVTAIAAPVNGVSSTFTVANTATAISLVTGIEAGTAVPTDILDLSGGSTVFVAGQTPAAGGGISGPSNQFTFAAIPDPLPVGASFGCTVTDTSSGNKITVYDVQMVKFTSGAAVPIKNCGGVGAPSAPAAPISVLDSVNQNILLTWSAPLDNGSPIDYYTFQSRAVAVGAGRAPNAVNVASGTCSGQVSPTLAVTGCTVLNLTPGTSYTFTVSAHNVIGSGPYSPSSAPAITFPTVLAPSISMTPATQSVVVGRAIDTVTVVNSGGPIATYTVATSLGGSTLPAGIIFDRATGSISGTPTSTSGSPITFTVTARNVTASSSATFILTVTNIGAPPIVAVNPSAQSVVAGSAMTPVVPTNTGGGNPTWSVTAVGRTLPTWIVVDTATGTLSGTPPSSETPTAIVFTISAINVDGTSSATLTLNVMGAPVISYSPATVSVAHGTPLPSGNSAIKPVNTGGAAASYTCATTTGGACPLPTGVQFSTSTGIFSGTPSITLGASSTTFSVTATNSAGTSNATLFILSITDPAGAGAAPIGATPVVAITNNVGAQAAAGTAVTLTSTTTIPGTISYSVTGANCQLTRNTLVATASNTTCTVTAAQTINGVTTTSQPVVFTFGLQAQAPLRISNRVAVTNQGLGITITTSGGSGAGALSYQVVTAGSAAGCRITTDGTGVTSSSAGVCQVTATKAASGIYDAIISAAFTFTFR